MRVDVERDFASTPTSPWWLRMLLANNAHNLKLVVTMSGPCTYECHAGHLEFVYTVNKYYRNYTWCRVCVCMCSRVLVWIMWTANQGRTHPNDGHKNWIHLFSIHFILTEHRAQRVNNPQGIRCAAQADGSIARFMRISPQQIHDNNN